MKWSDGNAYPNNVFPITGNGYSARWNPGGEMRPSCYIMIKEKRKVLLNLLQKHNSVPPPNISW